MYFTLKFLKHLAIYEDIQPYRIYGHPGLNSEEESNCEFDIIQNVSAQDIRNCQHIYLLENEGFEVVNSPSNCAMSAEVFEGRSQQSDEIIAAYLEETMDLVKRRLEATSVVTIDWRFRRNEPAASSQELEPANVRKQAIAVATAVHCDFSPDGGRERIQMHLTDNERDAVGSGTLRVKVVNVWRPLNLVKNAPLVLSDRRTISKHDLVEADQVMTDKVTKTAYLYHQANQKWFWLSDQNPDEVELIRKWLKIYINYFQDYSPHAAAYLHQSGGATVPRESIEVRMIVLQK